MGRARNFPKQEWASLKLKRYNIQGCVPVKCCHLDRHLVPVIESEFHFAGKTQPVSLNLCDTEKMLGKTALPLYQVTPFSHRVTGPDYNIQYKKIATL